MKKALNVRLPEALIAQIDAESRRRNISRSDVVRERLERPYGETPSVDPLASIRHLIGSVSQGPPDRSRRKKEYLRALIREKHYGPKRSR